jgi:prepilin peptidase CpaA
LQPLISLLGMGLLTAVAYCDVRTRRIPNVLAGTIAALGLVRIILTADPSAAVYTLAASAAVFAAGFLLFWRGLIGGGDVKLIAGTVLLVGYRDLYAFLLVMSVSGALVALAILTAVQLGLRPAPHPMATVPAQEGQEKLARLTVPYGVAIAMAGVFSLLVQSFVHG